MSNASSRTTAQKPEEDRPLTDSEFKKILANYRLDRETSRALNQIGEEVLMVAKGGKPLTATLCAIFKAKTKTKTGTTKTTCCHPDRRRNND